MIRALGSCRPTKGDEVQFDNGHYVLTTREGNPAIFHDNAYLTFKWSDLKERRTPSGRLFWVIDTTSDSVDRVSPVANVYGVEIGYNGEKLEFKVKAKSEGLAKNSAVGRLAAQLGLEIPVVWAMLKRTPNYIRILY